MTTHVKKPFTTRSILLVYKCTHSSLVSVRSTLSAADEAIAKRQAARQTCIKCQRRQMKQAKEVQP